MSDDGGVTPSEGTGPRPSNEGNTDIGQRDSGHSVGFAVEPQAAEHSAGDEPYVGDGTEAVGQPAEAGAYANRRLNLG